MLTTSCKRYINCKKYMKLSTVYGMNYYKNNRISTLYSSRHDHLRIVNLQICHVGLNDVIDLYSYVFACGGQWFSYW